MKKLMYGVALSLFFTSCGGSDAEREGDEKDAEIKEVEQVVAEVCECMENIKTYDEFNACNEAWEEVMEKYNMADNNKKFRSLIRDYNDSATGKDLEL